MEKVRGCYLIDFNDTIARTRDTAPSPILAGRPSVSSPLEETQYREYLREITTNPQRILDIRPDEGAAEAYKLLHEIGDNILATSLLPNAFPLLEQWLDGYGFLENTTQIITRISTKIDPVTFKKTAIWRKSISRLNKPLWGVFDDDIRVMAVAGAYRVPGFWIDFYNRYPKSPKPQVNNPLGPFPSFQLAVYACRLTQEEHGPLIA